MVDWNLLPQRLIWEVAVPLAAVLVLTMAARMLSQYAAKLWVCGKPDEWVLILRSGEMVRAGIGLKTFKGPFDQVATFPARVHKVDFRTEQVTNEMAGVAVSGMLVWGINRVGTGPLDAYKHLGTDLASDNPHSANDALTSMASAVVRSCIANSTINEMLTNRKLLRDAIKKEMFEVVKGWGVWLETVEITGVTISSQALFKDLQTNYRESVRKDAELFKMTIQSEIAEIQNKNDIEMKEKVRTFDDAKRVYQEKVQAEINDANEAYALEAQNINKRTADLKVALARNANNIAKRQEDAKLLDSQNESAEIVAKKALDRQTLRNDAENALKKLDMELETANMDEHMLRHEALMLAKRCYGGKYIQEATITSFDKSDPSNAVVAGVLAKLDTTKPWAFTENLGRLTRLRTRKLTD